MPAISLYEKRRLDVEKEILDTTEAAEFLGVSVDTLVKYLDAAAVPYRTLGTRRIFSRRALILWAGGKNLETA